MQDDDDAKQQRRNPANFQPMYVTVDVINVVMLSDSNYSSHRTNVNVTSSSSAKSDSVLFLNYSPVMTVLVASILGAFVIATVFGNFLVVLSLYRYRFLRTVSNYLIGNLALSDFLLAVTVLPLSSVNESLGHWVFGRTLCNLWLLTDVLCCTASIWNLCAIAFDRFTATLCPVWYRDKRSSKQVVVYVTVVWLISSSVCLPPVLGWNDLSDNYVFDNRTGAFHCVLFQTPSYVVYSANGSFFLPFLVTLALYVAIFATLRLRGHRMRRVDSSRSLRQRAPSLCPAGGDPVSERLLLNPIVSRSDSRAASDTSANADMGLFAEAEEMEDASSVFCPPLKTFVFSRKTRRRRSNGTTTIDDPGSPGRRDLPQYQPCSLDPLSPPAAADADAADQPFRDEAETTTPLEASTASPREDQPPPPPPPSPVVLPASTNPRGSSSAVKASSSERRFSSTQRYEQREMRATVRMAVIIAAFCGMWLGFFLLYTIRGLCPDCYVPRELNAFFFWLGYSNSSVNPVLYTIFNDEFKRAFSSILRRPRGGSRKYGKRSSLTQRRSTIGSTVNPRWLS